MKNSVRIFWKIFFWGMGIIVLLFTCANFGLFGKMPSLKELENPEADLASEIYTADGKLMGKYYSENRSEVKYHQIAPNIINALIATEDERFKEHSGIDGRAVARAVFSLGSQGGGSTITQQLAKMMLGQGRGNIITRGFQKIKEWIVAVKLERNFTKEEIITLYLNRASWGGSFGIRNAARMYYQKEPAELTIEEAAVLVGMLKGPSLYDPIRHAKASVDRRNIVISQMENAGYVTEEQATKLKAKPLITNYRKPDESVGIAPYFRVVLADKLKEWCKTHKNLKTDENYDLYRDGLKIYTTIDSRMQQYAEESVVQHMPVIQRKLNNLIKANGNLWKGKESIIESAMKYSERWKSLKEEELSDAEIKKTFSKPVKMKVFAWNAKRELDTIMSPIDSIKYHKQLLQTSFAALDPKTGEVKCWVGGIDFKWFKYDHITALRQVGSTIKPLIYTLGVQEAGFTPSTVIPGGAVKYGNEYRTFSGGGGTMANCLAFSKNTASVYLTNTVGVSRVIEFSKSVGIKAKLPPYTSIALGSAEIPMLEMLQSYTMFPNKGYNTEPVMITRIEDKNGNLLQEFNTETKQIITEQDAYTMVKLMEGVVKIGTGRSLNNYDIPAEKAGKTGTTNDNTDGWFIGYTPELLAGTWVGCDDPFIRIYAGTSGGNEMALPKWGFFMKKVYADKSLPYGVVTKFEEPSSFANDPVYADVNFENLVNKGEEENIDQGNGNAEDFMEAPVSDLNIPETPIESEIKTTTTPPPAKKDTASAKPKAEMPAAKPADKKGTKPEEKNKKQEKSKQKDNDY